ncbi:universal stress protein [Rhizobium sp. 007]|uniref:universal stress protein n=1 Tax=Rhizobium sp. 007 TaxID=2785056 RepID=UPI001FEF7187|nr:universal stress protein [Rhizobium sp. 007]
MQIKVLGWFLRQYASVEGGASPCTNTFSSRPKVRSFPTDALEKALAFAKEIGAKATVLTVVEPAHIFSTNIDQLESAREEYDRHSQQVADRVLANAGARARTHGLDCDTTQVTNHEPAKAIVDTAAQRGCDLIAMASHGREGFTAFMVGSVTMKMLAHSEIPGSGLPLM